MTTAFDDSRLAILAALRRVRMLGLAIPLFMGSAVPLTSCSDSTGPGGECCKICREGKACGDTCIERSKSCNVGRGCACDG